MQLHAMSQNETVIHVNDNHFIGCDAKRSVRNRRMERAGIPKKLGIVETCPTTNAPTLDEFKLGI